ncbi:hypothetical protein QAD02_011312 [Eretmocerus hayati]|uniref:Uncharacterized protein n=1 Tax=Eretmocerus hayati TaxID=131215 RepID=A0ACC2NXJ9_9HYME|nr:hypothetical protein QAD02_011312 [Eretmocerus hayati]
MGAAVLMHHMCTAADVAVLTTVSIDMRFLLNSKEDRSFLTSTDFTNYKSILTLTIREADKTEWQHCIDSTFTVLVGLAKFTKILGKTYDFKDMTKLIKDDKAVLIGALLLRFNMVLGNGCPIVRLVDPNRSDEDHELNCKFGAPCNHTFPLAALHTLEGCIPNVELYPSHENQYVVCAIRPIKAGEKLTSYIKSISIWHVHTKLERQARHSETYGCACNCQACIEDWSDSLHNMTNSMTLELKTPVGLKLWEERNSIVLDWDANNHKMNFPDSKIVSRAANLVNTAWKEFSMPSAIMLRSVYILMDVLRAFHDPSEICVKDPSLRNLINSESVYDLTEILRSDKS